MGLSTRSGYSGIRPGPIINLLHRNAKDKRTNAEKDLDHAQGCAAFAPLAMYALRRGTCKRVAKLMTQRASASLHCDDTCEDTQATEG